MHEGDFLNGRYRLVRVLGRGAMGQVWLAFDSLLNRNVAIKHLVSGSQGSLNEDFVQRAMREARVASQLDHPNAVRVFDLVMSDGVPHVVMEYVPGETLADRLAAAGRLAPHEIRPVIRQVALCLAAAHELGIVHRDVKPANILLAANGGVKLADFGIARAATDAHLTNSGMVVGTLAYMAPEVAAGDPATPSSDVWSLGATAYAVTEGRPPFSGESSARMLYRKVSEPPPMPTGAGELTELMRAMMATEAAERPAARDVGWALEGNRPPHWTGGAASSQPDPTNVRHIPPGFNETVLRGSLRNQDVTAGASSAQQPDPTAPQPSEPRRRGGLIAAAVVLALGLAGGTVALVLANRSGNNAAAGTTQLSDAAGSGPSATVTVTSTPSQAVATTAPRRRPTIRTITRTTTPSPAVATRPRVGRVNSLSRYYGPNGLSADGPASWNNACAGADGPYYWCAGPQGFLGGYFRLRLKNPDTSSFRGDVQSELTYFRTKYADGTVHSSPVYGWSVSGEAVDLTYTFTNSQGMARKGIERVFTVGSTTFIIATTDVRTAWPRTRQVFQQLVDSAEI